MKNFEILNSLIEMGIIAVIRADSAEQGKKIVDAVCNGGIKALEITMTVPFACDIIKELSIEYESKGVIIGAGTVLDAETARLCIYAGAKFIVSPCFCADTARLCNRYSVPYIPGVMTPAEIIKALESGCTLLKIFPADVLGTKIISAFSAPFPQAAFMPTGGITVENSAGWIKAGASVIGTGGSLTKGAKTGCYGLITETSSAFVRTVAEARK